jgi:Zn-dependent protease with chaperone function
MTGAVLLAGYATAAGLGGPALLRGWPAYALRLGIVAWLALPASCIAAAILAALAVAAPSSLTWSGGMTGPDFATPGGLAAAVAGLLLAAAIMVRAAWCLAGAVSRGRRERHAHAAFLAAAGRADRTLGAVVLDQDAPAAYCLPGGPGPVVSTGTLAVLEPGQLRAVLAHERAHLRGHHHAMLTWAAALGRAFGFVPLLARAAGELAVLAEMAADDAAARRHPAEDLAAALVIMAKAGAQATALTAGGPAAVARIERLLAPPERPARVAAAAAALIPPALIACLLLLVAACDVTPHR